MFRISFALAAIVLMGGVSAQSTSLPEDASKYSIVIIDSVPPTAAGDRLAKSFDTDPALRVIASQCHRHKFDPASQLYQQRYGAAFNSTALPALAVVRHDGGVIYKASGDAIPSTSELATLLTDRATADRALDRHSFASTQDMPQELQPFLRQFDRLIPDSITVRPNVSLDGLGPVLILIAGVLVVISVAVITLIICVMVVSRS